MRIGRAAIAVVVIGLASVAQGAPPPVRFAEEIQPILAEYCYQCHGPDAKARQADLRLDTQVDALRTENPVIVPRQSSNSALLQRILSDNDDQRMPPPSTKRKLTAAEIETIRRWIEEGAAWGKHWSLEPVESPRMREDDSVGSAHHRIDVLLQRRLAREGLKPAATASKPTWLRRATLDLNGLPPRWEDVASFTESTLPDAWERETDRLLASPAYGERMVWDWLDAARYADTNGYQGDGERTMWPWRDWAARSFNANMPFDQFTIWQIAGDLVANADVANADVANADVANANVEQRLATGFCRNHMINGEGGRIAAENRIDYVMDMTETAGTVWLGMTFNCCRCHDHKFDPLSQRDYYQLFAFFNNTPVDGNGGDPQTRPVLEVANDEQQAQGKQQEAQVRATASRLEEHERQIFPRGEGQTAADAEAAKALPAEVLAELKVTPASRNRGQLEKLSKHFTDRPDYQKLLDAARDAIDARDRHQRSLPRVMIMEELASPRETFVLLKGMYDKPTDKVEIGVPNQLLPFAAEWPKNRLGLAKWLVAPSHPLTPRVLVNRFWSQFFGVGIVKTTEDFGVQGERPEHPELLDALAHDFVEQGWDVKRLVRAMVLSYAYRQSSSVSGELVQRDPENRWLARGPRHRLPSWMLRDQALAVSGLLSRRIGGPPVKTYQPAGVWEEATFGTKRYEQDHGESLYRRSMYTFWRRIVAPTIFFDTAARQTCTVKQSRTNTPLHALQILNDVTYLEAARGLAEQMLSTAEQPSDVVKTEDRSVAKQVGWLYRTTLLREPSAAEVQILVAAYTRLKGEFAADPQAAEQLLKAGEHARPGGLDPIEHATWTAIGNTLLNLDETLCKE